MWEPIETAPTTGEEVLLYREDAGVFIGRWTAPIHFLTDAEIENENLSEDSAEAEGWFYADFVRGGRLYDDTAPTHWMPLPEPPTVPEIPANK